MGLFDFFKPKPERELDKFVREANAFMYPNGKADYDAGVNELLSNS